MISPLRDHYNLFRNQYHCTAKLFLVAIIGAVCLTTATLGQQHLLGAFFLLVTIAGNVLIYYRSKARILNWEGLSRGWQLLILASTLLLLREFFNLGFAGLLPFSSLILLSFTVISQVALTFGLMLLAWSPGKNAQIRTIIDAHVIVLALVVMAWAKGVHPFYLNLLESQSSRSLFYSWMLWANTVSGVLLLMSILFFFIAAHNLPRTNRSFLWVVLGASCFFLVHLFRTYAIGKMGLDHLSASWLVVSCVFTICCITSFAAAAAWHNASIRPDEPAISPSQASSQRRLLTLWFPYGVALAVALILLIDEIIPTDGEGSGLLPIVLLLIAILSRQMLTMWDNLRLSLELTGSNTNLEISVTERTKHLAILHKVTSTLNSSLDKNSVVRIALEQIMEATHAKQGAIWLRHKSMVDPEAIEWHLAYAKGFSSKDQEDALRDAAIATVDSETVLNNKIRESFEKAYDFQITSGRLLAVPIRSGGLLLGVQALIFKKEKSNHDTRSVVESVALEMGTSLQNAQLYQEARQRADRDGVTGLLNHRAIQEQLAKLVQASRKSGEPFSVLMMDLNDFKYFNDTYGHPVGDDVLRSVAKQLEKIGGSDNPVGRYGGDEFILLLPNQGYDQAHQTYQTLIKSMTQEHFEVAPGVRIPINLSYGWAVFPDDGKTALDLITMADANLYRYKQRGELDEVSSTKEHRIEPVDKSTSFGVLDALITAIDNKDHYTRKHSGEVAHYALMIAEKLEYSTEELHAVRISGLLHDVGKIAVPDDILRHPGKLSRADWEIMKGHPTFGALIVKDLPNLEEVITGIQFHHERWDGRGYPDGLSGTDIPIMGRLLAVPDTYSALTTNRPYRKGHSPQEALLEIKRSILTQFDPLVAKTFIEIMQQELGINDLSVEDATP